MRELRPAMKNFQRQPGFTLMEVLVALVITGLTVTVFFQLLSSGLRLEFSAEKSISGVVDLGQAYNRVLSRDVRDSDFQWSEEHDDFSWSLRIEQVETQESIAESEKPITLSSELYRYVFHYKSRNIGEWTITRLVQHEPEYFSQDFKNTHVE